MNDTERIVLKEIANSLDEATETTWKTGYFDDWVAYAKQMKNTINNVVPLIKKLASDENKDKS